MFKITWQVLGHLVIQSFRKMIHMTEKVPNDTNESDSVINLLKTILRIKISD